MTNRVSFWKKGTIFFLPASIAEGRAQQHHAHNVSSQSQVHGVGLLDPLLEALQGKAGWYPILGRGQEVPLGVEELCGHSHETIPIISASTMTL